MPSLVVYTFIQGTQRRELLFERVLAAVYTAVMDLHARRAAPLGVHWGGRRLYDPAALERVWTACKPELNEDRWQVPGGLEAEARRELAASCVEVTDSRPLARLASPQVYHVRRRIALISPWRSEVLA
jgi:hypothetical protein